MWVSLLREATTNHLNVTIGYPDGSSTVQTVQLGTSWNDRRL